MNDNVSKIGEGHIVDGFKTAVVGSLLVLLGIGAEDDDIIESGLALLGDHDAKKNSDHREWGLGGKRYLHEIAASRLQRLIKQTEGFRVR